MEVLRIFYDTANKIIWTHGLEGTGDFPITIEDDLKELPQDTQCLELFDPELIKAFNASSTNIIQDGKLIIGEPDKIIPVPESPNVITLKKYLADPHSGLPDLETAFLALVRLYLGG